MPVLYVLAGPNGTGKTTFYYAAIQQGFISPDLAFLNVDIICRNELGGYSAENFARADEIARQRIQTHISQAEDFMIESNLAVQSDYDWLQKMQLTGYKVNLFYLGTSDVEINIQRVHNRVKEGGHDIAVPIIRQRFGNSLMYLKGKLHTFESVYLIDNSEETALLIGEVKDGKIAFKADPFPKWAKELLYISERLNNS